MLYGEINRQRMKLINEHVVADTIDYLDARFAFSEDWDGLEKWAHFAKDVEVYDIRLTDDCIRKEDHLNLSAGIWKVYLHGNEFSGGKVIERITTNAAIIKVEPTGALNGEPFPEIPASVTEQIFARLDEVEQNGGGSGGGISRETDPTVPDWAKQPEKPKYTSAEVGAASAEQFNQLSEAIANLPTSGGMSETARNLLITILRNGVYGTDQSANITALATALESGSGGEDEPSEPEAPTYTITNNLTETTTSNAATTAERNTAYTATLTPSNGYRLNAVTVTMGGVDITDTVYADGVISIPAVTGDVTITAAAVVDDNVSGYVNLFDKNTMIFTGGFAFGNGYIYNNAQSKYAVIPVEAGNQYAIHGWNTYSNTNFGGIVFSSDDDLTENGKEYYAKTVTGIGNFKAYDSTGAETTDFTISTDTTGSGLTFTVPNGMNRIAVSVYIATTEKVDFSNTIMVEVGDTCHDYVPYAG